MFRVICDTRKECLHDDSEEGTCGADELFRNRVLSGVDISTEVGNKGYGNGRHGALHEREHKGPPTVKELQANNGGAASCMFLQICSTKIGINVRYAHDCGEKR